MATLLICFLGIKEIADLAVRAERELMDKRPSTLDWPERIRENWKMEGTARCVARKWFKPIFCEILERDLLDDLENVIFEVAYPTHPARKSE